MADKVKRIAKCRSCGQPLGRLTHLGTETGSKQCINRECKKYGRVA